MATTPGILTSRDITSGWAGRGWINRDGYEHQLFFAQTVNIDADTNIVVVPFLGTPLQPTKATRLTLTGSLGFVYSTSLFLQMMYDFKKRGIPPLFDMQYVMEDPGSSIGAQRVQLYDCMISSVPLAIGDASADYMTATLNFNYSDFEVLDSFVDPDALNVIPYLN